MFSSVDLFHDSSCLLITCPLSFYSSPSLFLSLSLFSPPSCSFSLFHPPGPLTLSFSCRIFYRALPRRTLLLSEFPVISRPQRGTPEATTLFAATTLKGDDGVHQLSARPYRSRRMPRGFAKGLVPSNFHRDEKEISLFPLARSTCSSMCELDERTKRTRQRYHAWEGEEGGEERAPLYVCLSVYPSVYLSVRPSVCRSV